MPRTRAVRTLARFDTAAIHAELRRRERLAPKWNRMRARIAAEIAALEAEIAALGGTPNGMGGARRRGRTGRRRPKNSMTLVEALAKALKGKTMSVTDAAEAVQKSGYRTASKTFRTQVNIAMIKSGRFKRSGRGMYTSG